MVLRGSCGREIQHSKSRGQIVHYDYPLPVWAHCADSRHCYPGLGKNYCPVHCAILVPICLCYRVQDLQDLHGLLGLRHYAHHAHDPERHVAHAVHLGH